MRLPGRRFVSACRGGSPASQPLVRVSSHAAWDRHLTPTPMPAWSPMLKRTDSKITFVPNHLGPVSVVGDFNRWDPLVHPLRRRSNGTRSVVIKLAPGAYAFRYLADGGVFFDEPDADSVEANGTARPTLYSSSARADRLVDACAEASLTRPGRFGLPRTTRPNDRPGQPITRPSINSATALATVLPVRMGRCRLSAGLPRSPRR